MILALLCRHRRLYVRGRRVHHGAIGIGLLATGLLLILDDLHDWPWRLLDT